MARGSAGRRDGTGARHPFVRSDARLGRRARSLIGLGYARPMRRTSLLWLSLVLGGCGFGLFGDDYDDGDEDGGGGEGWGEGGATEGGVSGGVSDTGGWGVTSGEPTTTGIEPTGADNEPPVDGLCPCVADNEDIYVLSDYGSIWRFDPSDLSWTFVTDVECGGMTSTFSMGVSRKGRAWVQYVNGDLYTVDLKDPGSACKDPGFMPGDPKFPNFGMAFVTEDATNQCDRLYAHSGIEPGLQGPGVGALGVIDPQTLVLSEIAAIDSAWGELTGTGDGRLFAFEGDVETYIREYDKATGAVLGTWALPGLANPDAFAFAYWGGDFYLFVTKPNDLAGQSMVLRLDFDESDGNGLALTTAVETAPIRIVGAGVSTCAPL